MTTPPDLWMNLREARQEGYDDDEIFDHVSQTYPEFTDQFAEARQEGYTSKEILDHVTSVPSATEAPFRKIARLAGQQMMGRTKIATFPYDMATIASKFMGQEAAPQLMKQEIFQDIENLSEKKMSLGLDEEEEEELLYKIDLFKDPNKINEIIESQKDKVPNFDVPSIIEHGFRKGAGIDIRPEDFAEEVAEFTGFIKGGSKGGDGLRPFIPTMKELSQATFASGALEMAREGQFGPIGTMGAIIAGDFVGRGAYRTGRAAMSPIKTGKKIYQASKKPLADFVSMFATDAKKQIQKDLKDAGLEKDIGSLTDSSLVKFVQDILKKSGLTGQPFEEQAERIKESVLGEYEKIASNLGDLKHGSKDEAIDAVKDFVRKENLKFPFMQKPIPANKFPPLKNRVAQTDIVPKEVLLDTISPTSFKGNQQAGKSLKEAAKPIQERLKKNFSKAFDRAKFRFKDIKGQAPELLDSINEFLEKTKSSTAEKISGAKGRVSRVANLIRNDLIKKTKLGEEEIQKLLDEGFSLDDITNLSESLEKNPELKNIGATSLWEIKQALKDVANWEYGGSSYTKAFKKFYGDVNEAFYKMLREENPELAEQMKLLDSEYAKYKEMFENDNVKHLFDKTKDYSKLWKSFLNEDAFLSLKEILSRNSTGRDVLKKMERDFADNYIKNKRPTNRELGNLREILGESAANAIDEFDKRMEKYTGKPVATMQEDKYGIRPTRKRSADKGLQGRKGSQGLLEKAENQKVRNFLQRHPPEKIWSKMDKPSGIKELERILPEEMLNELKRFKLQEVVGDQMVDNAAKQLKFGTFSSVLNTPKKKELVKALLPPEAYKQLEFLTKHTAELGDSFDKYYQISKQGTLKEDSKILQTVALGAFTMNPWLTSKVGAGLTFGRITATMMADEEFLSLLKQSMRENKSGAKEKFKKTMDKLIKKGKKYTKEIKENPEEAIEYGKAVTRAAS